MLLCLADRPPMKLYQKLLLGFALVALLVACVGYVAQTAHRRMEHGLLLLSGSLSRELDAAAEMASALHESEEAARQLLAGEAEAEALRASLDRFGARLAASRAPAEQHGALLERLAVAFAIYREEAERFIVLAGTEPEAAHAHRERRLRPQVREELLPLLAQQRASARTAFEAGVGQVREEIARADRLLFGAVLLAIGLTLVLGVLFAHALAAPLAALVEATRSIGRGRFEHRVRADGVAEVRDLAAAVNAMAEELSRTTVSKRYLDAVLRSMADPLFVSSTEGLLRMANPALHAALGYEAGALVGLPVERLFAEAATAHAALAEALERGHAGRREATLRRAAGRALPVAFSAALLRSEEGQVQGVVWVARDTTEQKLYERELVRAKEHAEALARLRSHFLNNMSHEIRTPLNGIIGSAQLLAAGLEGEEGELAHIIELGGLRLLSTINSVLDMARIEAGELQPLTEPLALAAEAREATGVLRGLAEAKGLRLRIEEAAPEVWVEADAGFVHRILDNLLSNAIKFTSSGGVAVEVAEEGRWGVLRIRDSGQGISEAFLPHLFDEFKQESTGLGRRAEGSGLGLAITRKLVEMMEGEIEVESVLRAGSTFTVRLPRAVPRSRPAPHREPEDENAARRPA